MKNPLEELLKERDLPIGLVLWEATIFKLLTESRRLMVFFPSSCEVGFCGSEHLPILLILFFMSPILIFYLKNRCSTW
jgi:hypothetical protein